MADVSSGRLWPILYSIIFTCILFNCCTNKTNFKLFESYVLFIKQYKFSRCDTFVKKRGDASSSVLSALTHTDTPEKKNNKKRHFLILNFSVSS